MEMIEIRGLSKSVKVLYHINHIFNNYLIFPLRTELVRRLANPATENSFPQCYVRYTRGSTTVLLASNQDPDGFSSHLRYQQIFVNFLTLSTRLTFRSCCLC